MNVNRRALLFAGTALLAGALASPATCLAAKRLVFGGGPAGGTFQIVADAIRTYGPVKASEDYRVEARSSAGSVENLRKVNFGKMHLGVVYSGHVYLGREGRLKNDDRRYEDVFAVSYLYGAPAQLVVHKGSGIRSVRDLAGKKVGVGNAGSGAFANLRAVLHPPRDLGRDRARRRGVQRRGHRVRQPPARRLLAVHGVPQWCGRHGRADQ